MFGSIMPAPLAMPAMVMVLPSQTKRAVTDFGRVSEVRMAWAERTPSAASRERRVAETLMPSATLAIGSSSPIRPVEQTRKASFGAPTAAAESRAIAAASASPWAAVQALALPLLPTMPRILSADTASTCWQNRTGAAFTSLVVNTPAAAHGWSATTSVRSRRSAPLLRMSQPAAPTRKPGTSETPGESLVNSMDMENQRRPSDSSQPIIRLRFWTA